MRFIVSATTYFAAPAIGYALLAPPPRRQSPRLRMLAEKPLLQSMPTEAPASRAGVSASPCAPWGLEATVLQWEMPPEMPAADASMCCMEREQCTGHNCDASTERCLWSDTHNEPTSFDTIWKAWISIFTVLSTEGWSKHMEHLQDAYSSFASIYFLSLIIFGAYFALRLRGRLTASFATAEAALLAARGQSGTGGAAARTATEEAQFTARANHEYA